MATVLHGTAQCKSTNSAGCICICICRVTYYIPRTNDPKDCSRQQNPVVVAHGKCDAAAHHHEGAQCENRLSPQAVGHQRETEADANIAHQRQRHEQTDPGLGDAERLEVEHQDERRCAIGEEADESLQTEKLDVGLAVIERNEAQLGEEPDKERW